MTNKEVCLELRKLLKPYAFIGMPQSTFSTYLIKIEDERCKPKTVNIFFEQFGYFGTWNDYRLTNKRTVLEEGKEPFLLLFKSDFFETK